MEGKREHLIENKLGWMPVGLSKMITEESLVNLYLYNQSPVAGHLWFLGSLFYALVMMLVFVRLKIDRNVMAYAPLLLGIYLFFSYTGGGEAFKYRNALFVTLPYFMMGCLIRKHKETIASYIKPNVFNTTTVIFAILVVVEYMLRRNIRVPYLSIEVLIYLIVITCLRYSDVGKGTVLEWLGSKCTLFVYIVHIGVLWIIGRNITWPPALITVLVFVIPLGAAAVIEGMKVRLNTN